MNALQSATDFELIHKYKEGDEKAFEILFTRHRDKLYSTIFYLVKDHFTAEDIYQEAFIKIIDSIRNEKYNDEGKFLPWAVRIAHNLCLDYFRKQKRTPSITNSDDVDFSETMNFTDEGPEATLIKNQSHDKIRKLIEKLPDDQREVIVLRHYAELSFKEIAKITNCPINTALGRMRYALNNLRGMM